MRQCLFLLLLIAVAGVVPLPALADAGEDFVRKALTVTTWKWIEVPHTGKKTAGHAGIITHVGAKNPDTGEFEATFVFVVCAKGQAGLAFNWENKNVFSKKGLDVRYRFAGQPERRIKAVYRNNAHLIEDDNLADVRQFMSDAAISDSLYVQVTSTKFGTVGVTLEAKGGKEMVEKFAAECPRALGKKR